MLRYSLGLVLLFKGAQCGQYCKQYISGYTNWYQTYYCDGRCCGSMYDDDCCEDRSSYIAAAVIGSIVGFLVLAAFVVCILKACTRKYQGGRVISPGPNVFVVSGVSHYGRPAYNGHPGTFTVPQPPPYIAGPAPPYSPYGRKDRFEPRPTTSSSPPAYSAGQPQAGTSSNPAGPPQPQPHPQPPYPMNPAGPPQPPYPMNPAGPPQPQPHPQPQPPYPMNPAGPPQPQPPYPMNPAGGPEVQNPAQPTHPPPAYSSLRAQDPASSPIPQESAGRPPATAPSTEGSPAATNPAGGNGSGTN